MNIHAPRIRPYQWTDEKIALLRSHVKDRVPFARIVAMMPIDENGVLPTRNSLIGKMRREGVAGESEQYEWSRVAIDIVRRLALVETQAEIARRLPPDANGRVANYRHVQRKAKKLGLELIPYERQRLRIKRPPVAKPKRVRVKAVAPKQMVWAHLNNGAPGLVLRECQPMPTETQINFTPLRVSLMDRALDGCKWPLGDPRKEDFGYCGLKSEFGRPYCMPHLKIAFTSAAERTRTRAKWLAQRGRKEHDGVPA